MAHLPAVPINYRCALSNYSKAPLAHGLPIACDCSLADRRVEDIDVAAADVLVVQFLDGLGGILLTGEEDESVAGGFAARHVDDDVFLGDGEGTEELRNVTSSCGERKSAKFQGALAIFVGDEI